MKMTKKIEIINVRNEKVIIEPMDYDIALNLAKFRTAQAKTQNEVMKLCVQYIDNKDPELKIIIDNLNSSYDIIEEIESGMRNKYGYWYVGVDNLENVDKEKYDLTKIK